MSKEYTEEYVKNLVRGYQELIYEYSKENEFLKRDKEQFISELWKDNDYLQERIRYLEEKNEKLRNK